MRRVLFDYGRLVPLLYDTALSPEGEGKEPVFQPGCEVEGRGGDPKGLKDVVLTR